MALTPTERPNSTQIASLDELLAGLSTSYKIPQKNILTHRQVATSSKYGRGRKSDPFGLDFEKI
ncbi:MAG: N-acetylmuramoyl-L-alanine amidase [Candidatus Peribacteria bacterium]|nr:N-acetylmuramoyl-L-alanine amidase [Candidatus Peribacteria bacterium]